MVTPKYYSQAGQDAWVFDIFNFKRNGFFVDIGAYDGVHLSNSYFLEQMGWKGICVEAGYNNFLKLKINRKCAVHTAISNYNGTCAFNEDEMYGKITGQGKTVTCNTIETILEAFNAPAIIDYLSLDIEGGEAAALSVFPFDKYTIRALTVEHNFYNSGPDNKNKIYGILTEAGYTRVKEVSADGLHFEDWYTKNI